MLSKKVILTLLIAIIACFIIGYFLFEPDSEELRKQMFAYKVHDDKKYDLVVAGDSRIYRGISTDIIGAKLGKVSINLGFSSGGYGISMFELIDKKIHKANGNIIILGITPLSLTDLAIENGHIKRLNTLKSEEIIEYLYLNKFINIFSPTTPRALWNTITDKIDIHDNYIQEVKIKEGWVKSDYKIPYPDEALESYNKTFTNTSISQRTIDNLFTKINKWADQGFLVYGFIPPTSANMEELERQFSDFDDSNFAHGFIKAGGRWICFDDMYSSYDGSHLDSKSAIKLSMEIANAITNKTYLSGLTDSIRVKTNYYQFISKYSFQNDFENDTINSRKTDHAYSGNQVLVCDHNTKYLRLYSAKGTQFLNNNVKTVLIDFRAYYEKENASAILAIEINQNGQNILWKGLEIPYIVRPSNWGRVRLEASIPYNISPEAEIKIYIINKNNSHLLIDDFKLDMY